MKSKSLPSDYELIYKPLCSALRKCKGKERSVNNTQLQNIIAAKTGWYFYPTEIRLIIHHIKINKDVKNLIAGRKGYYVAKNKKEVALYVESLKLRAGKIINIAMSYL